MKKSPRKHGGRQPRRCRELAVLYEDDAVVVLHKPAGPLSVPAPGSDAASAWSILSAELKSRRQRAYVVHRIDRFTSGVLLFAKSKRDRDALVQQFLAHTPVRQYLAVVRGHLSARQDKVVHYLRREEMFQKLSTEKDSRATRAELRYTVEQSLRRASLVRVTLVTGLQNQIRVQFAALGHPVIGDRKYSAEEASERKIDRVALHAAHLEFAHPRTGKTISADCPLPPDMKTLLQFLAPTRPQR